MELLVGVCFQHVPECFLESYVINYHYGNVCVMIVVFIHFQRDRMKLCCYTAAGPRLVSFRLISDIISN